MTQTDTADRVMMIVADKLMCDFLIERRNWVGGHRLAKRDEVAAALSSHGLRELIDAAEDACYMATSRLAHYEAVNALRKALATLGDTASVPASAGETVNEQEQREAEEQTNG